jgi:pseudaminic acid cytidylyltransferase
MKIAIIPARGGSKRVPRKNIRNFAGVPMISRAVAVALKSELFAYVVVSTDDPEIATAATAAGAVVPFARPANLSDDKTPTVPVVAHAVRHCLDAGWDVTHACCIYPCTPLLAVEDLRGALELLLLRNADFVYPVTEYAHPIQRALRLLPSGQMEFLQPENELTRTQDLEKTFHDAGQFYWGNASAWLAEKRMHSGGHGYRIPHWRVVDIDTDDDWLRAELIYQALQTRRS